MQYGIYHLRRPHDTVCTIRCEAVVLQKYTKLSGLTPIMVDAWVSKLRVQNVGNPVRFAASSAAFSSSSADIVSI